MLAVAADALGAIVSLGADAGIMASGGGAAFGVASLFLRSRFGRWAMMGIAGGLMLLAAYVAGVLNERADNKRAGLEARITNLEFELKTATELADLGFAQLRALEGRSAERHEKVTQYAAQRASKPVDPDDGCTLDRDDVRWLCDIRGGC